ncbi:MAG: hypothetical protein AAFY72_08140 [Cyanobacteria bacterium J06649_4]
MRFQHIKAEHRLDELTLEILHEGDCGFAVKQLQYRLASLGHYHASEQTKPVHPDTHPVATRHPSQKGIYFRL